MALDKPRATPLQSGEELREEFRIARGRQMTRRGACTRPPPGARADEGPAPPGGGQERAAVKP